MNRFHDHVRRAVEIVGSQEKLAKAIGLSQPSVHHLCTEARNIRGEVAIAIEQATGGAVSRLQLRPDLFRPANVPSPSLSKERTAS